MENEQIRNIRYPDKTRIEKLLERPTLDYSNLMKMITEVFSDIRVNGDESIMYYTEKFDKVQLETLQVNQEMIRESELLISESLKNAINNAYHNIYKFHRAQLPQNLEIEVQPGIKCWQKYVPIESIGLYIPGGSAPLFSTVLMLGIPAKIAGCERVIMCTPPDINGKVHPAILYAASLCGIQEIYQIGGSQAIAAMAIGTETINAVYKLFGPGNQYVTAAKQYAFLNGLAIDMPAGPSELMVYGGRGADVAYIASDLLSQAEHGADSQVILVTTQEDLIEDVANEIRIQLESLPRKIIAEQALQHSYLILFKSKSEAIDFMNEYAAEHLIIACDDALSISEKIINAGSIFLGHYTPESAGDYASGTNHTLPTGGAAKAFSGVSLRSFMKSITYQEISKKGLNNLGSTIMEMAKAENLEAHSRAVEIRMDNE